MLYFPQVVKLSSFQHSSLQSQHAIINDCEDGDSDNDNNDNNSDAGDDDNGDDNDDDNDYR